MAFDRERFRDLYPFEGRFLEVPGGHRLHYLDEGQGEPVVMVHGNPSWSFYWRELVQALRGTHRCIVPDHVGCGLSDKPGDDRYEYVLERRIEDLARLIDTVTTGRVTLAVHDWGGMIGLGWAVQHPERVARLVVTNTSAFRLPASKPMPGTLRLARTPLGPLLVRGGNAFARGAARMCTVKPLAKRVREGLVAPYDSWANRIATLRFVQDIPLAPGDRSWDAMLKIEAGVGRLEGIPLLVLWGEQDFVFDDHFLREWRRRFPRAEVHAFPDAGHYVLEDAADRIVPLVREFLARPALAGATS